MFRQSIQATALMLFISVMWSFNAFAQPGNAGCNARFTHHPDSVLYGVEFWASMYSTHATYAWDFGDGSTGSTWNLSHTYAAAGTYNVCLTVTRTDSVGDTLCSSTYCDQVMVAAPAPACDAHFTANQNMHSGMVQFVSARNRGIVVSVWNFGDGTTDTGSVANHLYTSAGVYYACLTVTKDRKSTRLNSSHT